jgi:hypothetical protein
VIAQGEFRLCEDVAPAVSRKDLDSRTVKDKFETFNVKEIDGALAEEEFKPTLNI